MRSFRCPGRAVLVASSFVVKAHVNFRESHKKVTKKPERSQHKRSNVLHLVPFSLPSMRQTSQICLSSWKVNSASTREDDAPFALMCLSECFC